MNVGVSRLLVQTSKGHCTFTSGHIISNCFGIFFLSSIHSFLSFSTSISLAVFALNSVSIPGSHLLLFDGCCAREWRTHTGSDEVTLVSSEVSFYQRQHHLAEELHVFRCCAEAESATEACIGFGVLHVDCSLVHIFQELLQQAVGKSLLHGGDAYTAVCLRLAALAGNGVAVNAMSVTR